MPRVIQLTEEARFQDTVEMLAPRCEMIMRKSGISQKRLSEFLGVSPQAVNQQFRNGHITIDTFVAVMHLANVPAEKMERLVSIK